MQNPFRKPDHSSLGSITLVRRSFISVRFSPPAAYFILLAGWPSPAFRGFVGTKPGSCKHATQIPFTVRPPWPDGPFTGRPSRWHSLSASVHSFLILSGGHQRLAKTTVPTSVRHGYASFCRRRFYRYACHICYRIFKSNSYCVDYFLIEKPW